jgi:peptidoglycan/xylan/chitin deacetylase (PgdA/CDA1 family)
MAEGRRALGALLGRAPETFAYPFGSHDLETARLAREAGFVAACTTASRVATPRADPMRIPRITVGDWDGDTFLRRLRRLTAF